MDIKAGDRQATLQRAAHPFRHARKATLRQNGEFILAQARQHSALTECVAQTLRQHGQHSVGAFVPQGLIEAAEAVEVADDEIVVALCCQKRPRGRQEARTVM